MTCRPASPCQPSLGLCSALQPLLSVCFAEDPIGLLPPRLILGINKRGVHFFRPVPKEYLHSAELRDIMQVRGALCVHVCVCNAVLARLANSMGSRAV